MDDGLLVGDGDGVGEVVGVGVGDVVGVGEGEGLLIDTNSLVAFVAPPVSVALALIVCVPLAYVVVSSWKVHEPVPDAV